MSILDNENVKELIRIMDLAIPKPKYLLIDKYDCEEDAIVIKRIKVLDSSGNCIKFAKLKEVTPHLCKFPVIFDERIQDTEKTD